MTTTMTASTSQFTHASNGMFFFPEPSTAVAEMVALMDGNTRQHGEFVVSVPFALVGGNRTEEFTFNVVVRNDSNGTTVNKHFAHARVAKAFECLDVGDFFFKFCDQFFAK